MTLLWAAVAGWLPCSELGMAINLRVSQPVFLANLNELNVCIDNSIGQEFLGHPFFNFMHVPKERKFTAIVRFLHSTHIELKWIGLQKPTFYSTEEMQQELALNSAFSSKQEIRWKGKNTNNNCSYS